MSDVLFGNNNKAVIKKVANRNFHSNKKRNILAVIAIALTTFLLTAVLTIGFGAKNTLQYSEARLLGSQADALVQGMTKEQAEQLKENAMFEKAGIQIGIAFLENTKQLNVELDYADETLMEVCFMTPNIGTIPKAENEVLVSANVLEDLGIPQKAGETLPVDLKVDGKIEHFDMKVSGIYEPVKNDVGYVMVSKTFLEEQEEMISTLRKDRENRNYYNAHVILKDPSMVEERIGEFIRSIGGNPDDREAENYVRIAPTPSATQSDGNLVVWLAAGVFGILFMFGGYLLIYNVFSETFSRKWSDLVYDFPSDHPSGNFVISYLYCTGAYHSDGFSSIPEPTEYCGTFENRRIGDEVMNDLLFGNNNAEIVKRLSKRYFKKNRIRNIAAILAIMLTAFLFTSVTSLAFGVVSSFQYSLQMQKGSKADGTLGYMTEEQFQQLVDSDFVEIAGHRCVVGYASNAQGHSVEINYADDIQQELTFCKPTHGKSPQKSNEIATTELALKALGVKPEIGASVPLEIELRGKIYHYDMVLSGWWEASNDSLSVAIISEQFLEENKELLKNTYAVDHEIAGVTFSDVVLKDKVNIKNQLDEFVYSIGGNPEDMNADNFILSTENQMSKGMITSNSILFAVIFILMFVICGYLLIHNIFDISVMQDVRQYGLLRTLGTSTRQIKKIVNRQAVMLTLIGLPIGLIMGFFVGWILLPTAMRLLNLEHAMTGTKISTSPLIFIIAIVFTIFTVFISTRKPVKKAAKISPIEAIRYTDQGHYKKRIIKRTNGGKLAHMAFSNLGRNKKRSGFIIISMLLCIVLLNSIIIITQSMDEEKVIKRTTKTDFTVYNSVALDMSQGFRLHEDTLSQQAVDLIRKQPGVQNERYLYRNTTDDRNVLVDYGFEKLVCESTFLDDSGIVWKDCNGYNLTTVNESENRCLGNIMGASENFWNDILVFEGEKDKNVLKEKMITGEYVIIGYTMDRSTEEPNSTPMTDELQVGDRISFFKDGELVKTCTILAKAIMVGTELETPMGTSAQMNIGGDAPFVYISDNAFKQIYDVPTLLSYGFNVDKTMQAQMEEFLNDYKENDSSVAYTSTKLLKEQMYAQRDILLIVGGMIGAIMAFAGLINFTNMMVTNIITRRHEFAAMQSIGMTNRQLRRLIMDEGLYYAAGADVIGGLLAAILGVTVLKNVLNSPSMWYFTLRFTLVPALFIAVIYLILAAIIPVVVLHFFNKGSVVERLRTE